MTDIVEFLEQRINEDEQAAREAGGERWAYDGDDTLSASSGEVYYPDAPRRDGGGFHTVTRGNEEGTMPGVLPEDGTHIARHNPKRALRESEAKRQALKAYADTSTREPDYWDAIDTWLRSIADVYADHPDYQPEWGE